MNHNRPILVLKDNRRREMNRTSGDSVDIVLPKTEAEAKAIRMANRNKRRT